MSLLINNVACDAFTHVDKRTVSDTVRFSLSDREGSPITVYLFCDNKAFPISSTATVECCIRGIDSKSTTSCHAGSSGEIVISIPDEFCVPGESLSCEINVSGTDDAGAIFRFKAANFIVAVIE